MTRNQRRAHHGPTLELRVRSLAPDHGRERQRAVVARLNQLEAEGAIGEYTVEVWGKQHSPIVDTGTTAEVSVHERLVELDEWAARTGLSAAQCFRVRTGYSSITDTEFATVVHPTMLLAEYDETGLRHASPCTDGETHYDVEDHLDALANGTERVPGSPETRPARVPGVVPAIYETVASTAGTNDAGTNDGETRADHFDGQHPDAPPESPDHATDDPIPPSH